jgi:hypothetical protein
MHSVLLELHAAEIMDVRRVPFHLLQHELDFGLRDHLLFVNAHNPRFLPKFFRPAAPTRLRVRGCAGNDEKRCSCQC